MKMLCPHCGIGGTAVESCLGRNVRCPGCQNIFRVSEEMVVEPAVEPERQEVEEIAIEQGTAGLLSMEKTLKQEQLPEIERKKSQGTANSDLDECSICGFSFSSEFITFVNNKPVCPACAG